MVDESHGDLAVVDLFQDGCISVADRGLIGLKSGEELPGLVVAVFDPNGGDERLERGIGWCHTNLALPLRLGQFMDRGGQIGFGDQVWVVGKYTGPGGDSYPRIIAGSVLLRYEFAADDGSGANIPALVTAPKAPAS